MSISIIAEAGVNHNGSVGLAKQMAKAARDAGADYVKFQTFVPEQLVSRHAQKAQYQKEATGEKESQLEMLKKLALSQRDFIELKQHCDALGIGFLSTPFDLSSIDFLETLNMDFWKLPSGEVTNYPYLVKIAKTGRKVVLSTGMCEIAEIREAVAVLEENGTKDIALLHCSTQYPTPFCDVNLRAMEHLKREFGRPAGYSDHSQGIEVAIAAAALGASVIEKHFTLDRALPGPDHAASLEPVELQAMIRAVRNVEICLGDGIKRRTRSEEANRVAARKSIVARCPIRKGEIFTEENLTAKRPGDGVCPMKWKNALGQAADRDYEADEQIHL